MIEIIKNAENSESFVNDIWIALNSDGQADKVFLCDQSGIDTHLVSIKSQSGLPEQNLFKFIKEGISFSEVNMSEKFNLMEKSRLFRIRKDLTEFISESLNV